MEMVVVIVVIVVVIEIYCFMQIVKIWQSNESLIDQYYLKKETPFLSESEKKILRKCNGYVIVFVLSMFILGFVLMFS